MALRSDVVQIPFESERHRYIIEALRQRYWLSYRYMSQRYPTWAKMEERFRAYVNLKDSDVLRKTLISEGRPQYVTIDVPYSYAMLLTAHTYWTSVFLSRNPVLQFMARTGQGQMKEQAVEAVMDYQLQTGQMMLPLYLWFMDAGKYGLGVLGNTWYEEQRVVTKIVDVPKTYMGIPLGGTKRVRQTQLINGYRGNKSFNIRPQDFFPDPRVPISRLQDGEFCGRMTDVGWNTIKEREAQGYYFNVDLLQQRLRVNPTWMRDLGSSQIQLPAGMDTLYWREVLEDPKAPNLVGNANNDKNQKSFIQLFEITVELIPRDWGLSNNSYPEKWAFVVANDEVVVCAMPAGADHGKYEYFALEYEIESYALNKRSMLEIVDPLNDVLSWLFNSHMYNVRKVLNDQLIVDPSRVVMKDFGDPSSGRLIRLKPEAYGSDPKAVYSQLQVVDVTQQNMSDLNIVSSIMQRVLGVNDNVMGMVNPGGRKTATEVRTSSTLGINRLKTVCEYMSAMGFTPWAEVLLANTQQRYDAEQQLRIAGSLSQGATPFIDVSPDGIAGQYDFVPVDGTMPIDRFAQANLWKELAIAMRQMPEVAQQFDWVSIMGWIAQLSGAKNFSQFRIKTNVVPDAAAAANAQAGNVVPIGGPGGIATGAASGPTVGGPETGPAVSGTPAVPGVGRTG